MHKNHKVRLLVECLAVRFEPPGDSYKNIEVLERVAHGSEDDPVRRQLYG